MLKWLKKLFSKPQGPKVGDKVGNVTILTEQQLIKHTALKAGDQYRLGQAIVTVHEDKASMLRAIAATEFRRMKKAERLTKRGEDLMMMTPEELLGLNLIEWFHKRQAIDKKISDILNGKTEDEIKAQFQELMKDWGLVKEKEQVS